MPLATAQRWFFLFVCIHLLAWSLAPILVRYNLPLDAIEGTLWGHQLEWGYDKNPYLNAWLTAFAVYLDGYSGWMVYVFSQLSVILCLIAIWQLANKILPPAHALIAVMLLEGIQYYNFHAIDFNDNNLELSLWALTIYFFYQALRVPHYRYWLLTGLFAGLGMMAKYYTITLLAAMAIFLLIRPENRKQLATLPPYLGLLVFCSVILPHVIWLFSHDFITVDYVFQRGSSVRHINNHFFYPAQFAWQQVQAFLPGLLLLGIVFLGKKPSNAPTLLVSSFNRWFLWIVGVGPFFLTLCLSMLLGTKLRAGWGMPLLSTWGIVCMMLLHPALTPTKIHRFIAAIFVVMALFITGYVIALTRPTTFTSANFPGRVLAATLTNEWRDRYHTPLEYVAGSRWLGGNISFYSSDHPAVFVEWDSKRAPWIDQRRLLEKGGIFVWDLRDGEKLPEQVRKAYPHLQESRIMHLSLHRNKDLPPTQVGVAFLPPQK